MSNSRSNLPRVVFFVLGAALFISLATAAQAAPFTGGNVVVSQVGDGNIALSSSFVAAPVFLREYNTSGAFQQEIGLPTVDNGANVQLTLTRVRQSGQLNLSSNGQYLSMAGYDIGVGTQTDFNVARVVARVDPAGTIDTTTNFLDAYNGNSGNINSAVSSDGSAFWLTGDSNLDSSGVRHVAFGGTTTTLLSPDTLLSTRNALINNGQLYVSSGDPGVRGISTVGTGLPTVGGQPVTLLPGFNGAGDDGMHSFVFLKPTGGPDTLYIADDSTTTTSMRGLQKYTFDGSQWNLDTVLTNGITNGLLQVTGRLEGGVATLYGITRTAGAGALGNSLVKLSDTGVNPAFQVLATAISSVTFRGVAFAPQAPPPELVGDANGDCIVNLVDVQVVGIHWMQTGPNVPGDVNHDGIVNLVDVQVVGGNWMATCPPGAGSAVPEPSTVLLAVVGLVCVGGTRWRHRRRAADASRARMA